MSSRGSGMRMSDTDFAEYDSKVTFMFPGQGAQYMGMAADICDEVNEAATAVHPTLTVVHDRPPRCKFTESCTLYLRSMRLDIFRGSDRRLPSIDRCMGVL